MTSFDSNRIMCSPAPKNVDSRNNQMDLFICQFEIGVAFADELDWLEDVCF